CDTDTTCPYPGFGKAAAYRYYDGKQCQENANRRQVVAVFEVQFQRYGAGLQGMRHQKENPAKEQCGQALTPAPSRERDSGEDQDRDQRGGWAKQSGRGDEIVGVNAHARRVGRHQLPEVVAERSRLAEQTLNEGEVAAKVAKHQAVGPECEQRYTREQRQGGEHPVEGTHRARASLVSEIRNLDGSAQQRQERAVLLGEKG